MEQVSNIPSTSAALPLLPLPQEEKRSISALHRDMWRIMRAVPLWSVIIPAALYLPTKVLLPLVGLEGRSAMLATFAGSVLGAVGYMAAVAAILEYGHSGHVDAQRVLGTLRQQGWKLIGCYLLSLLAFMTGFLLLVIPGFLVLMRLWIVVPVQMEEKVSIRAAFNRSSQLYLQRPSLMAGFVLLVFLLYWLPEWLCLSAAGDDALLRAALGVPAAMLSGLMPVLDVLLYAEITGPKKFQTPVGVRAVQQEVGRHFPTTGRRELAMVGVISLMLTAMAAVPAGASMLNALRQTVAKSAAAMKAKTEPEQRMTPAHPEEDDTTP